MKAKLPLLFASLFVATNAFNQATFVSITAPSLPVTALNTAPRPDLASLNQADQPTILLNAYTNDMGSDTTGDQNTKKKLVKTELSEVLVFDKNQLVHTIKNPFGNKAAISFTLPKNQTSGNKTTTVVAWACWVGVNDAARNAWQQNIEAVGKLPKEAASHYTTPLGAFAVGAVTDLKLPATGEDVYYAITNEANKNLFFEGQRFRLIEQGKGIAGYKKFTDSVLCQGTHFVCLSNDNVLIPLSVNIKVVAIVETRYYEDQPVQKAN